MENFIKYFGHPEECDMYKPNGEDGGPFIASVRETGQNIWAEDSIDKTLFLDGNSVKVVTQNGGSGLVSVVAKMDDDEYMTFGDGLNISLDDFVDTGEQARVVEIHVKTQEFIAGDAFTPLTELTAATIVSAGDPNYITYGAFSGLTQLTEVKLCDGIEQIQACAFSGCSNLYTIDLSRVEEFGEGSFNGCSALTSLNLSGARIIRSYSFSDCSSVSSITFGQNIEEIKSSSFERLSSLSVIHAESIEKQQFIEALDSAWYDVFIEVDGDSVTCYFSDETCNLDELE